MLDALAFSQSLQSRSFGNLRDLVRHQNGLCVWFCGKGEASSGDVCRELRGTLGTTKTLLVDFQRLDFGIESRLRNPEFSSSSPRARDPALTLRERRLDHLSFLC